VISARAGSRRLRAIVTPEGVALPFELATIGDRATAFAIDLVLCLLATGLIYLAVLALVGRGRAQPIGIAAVLSITLFLAFLVRNLYFIHFELAWQGATPGKRQAGIRVVDRKGGPLLPMAVVARNLTREFEFFVPFGMLSTVGATHAPLERLALLGWMLMVATLPFFNRDRMRAGDMIAGTMVVCMPRRVLLPDLIEERVQFVFADARLVAYGAFELQLLEEVLRRPETPGNRELRGEIAERIRAKIGWKDEVARTDVDRFLTDFYAAQRAYLERSQIYGKYRADKNAVPGQRPG
jgi:uncharacterized RDD family membrane protein YckC